MVFCSAQYDRKELTHPLYRYPNICRWRPQALHPMTTPSLQPSGKVLGQQQAIMMQVGENDQEGVVSIVGPAGLLKRK
jgi:hypothetical protein